MEKTRKDAQEKLNVLSMFTVGDLKEKTSTGKSQWTTRPLSSEELETFADLDGMDVAEIIKDNRKIDLAQAKVITNPQGKSYLILADGSRGWDKLTRDNRQVMFAGCPVVYRGGVAIEWRG